MSYETYKWLHIFSALCLFLAIGVLLSRYGGSDHKSGNKTGVMILHGLSVLVLFVSGFGLIARLQLHPFPVWALMKLVIWTVLALVVPLLLLRKPKLIFRKFCISPKYDKIGIWFIVIFSGLSAVLLAVLKPFY